MSVQYLSDAEGRQTAVVIPIEDWKRLLAKYDELNEPEKSRKKASDFVGILSKKTAQQMIADIDQSRNEWDEEKPRKKPSDFRGLFTSDEADNYHNYLQQARSEWDRDI